MDAGDMRGWLDDRLSQLDWSNGVSKTDLVLSVEDDEALRNLIGQYVTEGHYQTKVDVLTVIPEQAWQAAQGDTWRGGETYDMDEMDSGFMESPVVQDPPNQESTAAPQAGSSRGDQVRQRLASAAGSATAAARSGINHAPDLAHLVNAQARSLVTPPQETVSALSPRTLAVGLSALNEGLGQAYNGQYTKAGRFAVTGLVLSSLSGINTWLLRDVLGLNVRFGRKPRPFFILLWAATYVYNLWDAWTNAPDADGESSSAWDAANGVSFRPLAEPDFPMLSRWLRAEHLRRWWFPAGDYPPEGASAAWVAKHYGPNVTGKDPTRCLVVCVDGADIGLIQTYRLDAYPEHARRVLDNAEEAATISGLDIFIGEPDALHRGLGTLILRRFLDEVTFADPAIQACVIDPEPENRPAIRAYEKAGFRHVKTIPIGEKSVASYVMRVDRSSR